MAKTFKEVWAQKLRELDAHGKAPKVPKELEEDFHRLRNEYMAGKLPKSMPEAEQNLLKAAAIAQALGMKPSSVGGKDLVWPPSEGFEAPGGRIPYLSNYRAVMAAMFPPEPKAAPAPVKTAPAGPVGGDPLAGMKQMVDEAGIQVRSSKPPELAEVE